MANVSDERIRAMLAGRRHVRVFPMPGVDDVEVGVRILLEEETDAARLEAVQYVNAKAKEYRLDARDMLSVDAELLDREIQRQLVYRAFVDPESDGQKKLFFEAPQQVRQIDSVMQLTLFHIYLDHQNYVSPLRGMDERQVQELAEALGKGQKQKETLGLYDAPSLRSLVHILACQLESLLSGKSGTGTRFAAT